MKLGGINDTIGRDHEIDLGNVTPPGPQTTFDLPPFGEDQFNLLTSTDLTQGDPQTGERNSAFSIELVVEDGDGNPIDGEDKTLNVIVTDHLGTDPFDDAPNNGLSGSATVEFENGKGSFTIGGAERDDADLTLGFFGFLPEVNDVETIEIDVQGDGDIVDRTLELDVGATDSTVGSDSNPGSTAIDGGFADVMQEE